MDTTGNVPTSNFNPSAFLVYPALFCSSIWAVLELRLVLAGHRAPKDDDGQRSEAVEAEVECRLDLNRGRAASSYMSRAVVVKTYLSVVPRLVGRLK
jgi:hypothetical protein